MAVHTEIAVGAERFELMNNEHSSVFSNCYLDLKRDGTEVGCTLPLLSHYFSKV